MIKRRLTIRFVLQLAMVGAAVLALTAIAVIVVVLQLDKAKFSREFATVGLEKLMKSSELGKDGIRFAPELLEQVERNRGWLQTLDESGQVEFSYHTPPDVPKQYKPGELVEYWSGERSFPYVLYVWIEEKHGRTFTILYGAPNEIDPTMEQLRGLPQQEGKSTVELPADLIERLDAMHAFVQLLDSSGKELYAYNRPNDIPAQYTVQDLALRIRYSERYGYQMRSAFDTPSGHTWIVGKAYGGAGAAGMEPLPSEQARIVLTGIVILFGSLLLLFLAFSLWQAHRFGAPMLHMLNWLDNIARARYEEPADRKGVPHSRTSGGKWRRRYLVFADVMLSLNKLSGTLAKEQQRRAETERMREEWIAGVSHDLKTPLSSINGYAHLLAEPSYAWSQDEVRKFSAVMLEKAAHMDQLISDLEMTYRLKNGVQPPEWTEIEWNSWLSEVLEQAGNHPDYRQQGTIVFVPAREAKVVRMIYTPWLERIVHNLAANALLHNPPGTVLTVTLEVLVESERAGGLAVTFADNGAGMDEETSERLFERYYRGTDTATATNGSGLGMAIAKGLAEAMGGTIHVDTAPGVGTAIRLEWR